MGLFSKLHNVLLEDVNSIIVGMIPSTSKERLSAYTL